MDRPRIVSREERLAARKAHLAREKEFTRRRDQLSRERRELPWVKIEKAYGFDGPDSRESLADLFGTRSQLVMYHFMFGPTWEQGCKSCSFWADNFDGIDVHLAHRDTTFLLVSHAPFARIEAYRRRMGWRTKWVSSFGSDFNFDFHVSFTEAERAAKRAFRNFEVGPNTDEEIPGVSAFAKRDDAVFHTYSCYGRGIDVLNGAYNLLDLTPKGRDEAGVDFKMAWVRRHDQYED